MLTKADLDRWLAKAKAPPRPRAWRWICHPDKVAHWRRALPSCIEVVAYATSLGLPVGFTGVVQVPPE